jgi:ABC-type glycerol-3-phosphate transport system permease component
MNSSSRERLSAYLLLSIGAVIALYPMVSIVLLSLKAPGENLSGFSLPQSVYLENYVEAWNRGVFSQAMVASFVVAAVVVTLSVTLAVLASYGMSLMNAPAIGFIGVILLVGLVMPYEATVISLYEMMRSLGLLNSIWALILPQIAMSMPFGIFWMLAFFRTVPRSLQEAASTDGASRLQTLWMILIPIALPAIGTLAILLFLFTWNEFLLPLVLVPDNKSAQTVPLALSFFAGNRRNSQPPVTAAAAVLVALPILVMYVVLQRRMIQGIVSGAVKE